MLCELIVQGTNELGCTIKATSTSWYIASVPQLGTLVQLTKATSKDEVAQYGQVIQVQHYLASGDYFNSATMLAATIILTTDFSTVEYLYAMNYSWKKI
jgi:hypothetical protein